MNSLSNINLLMMDWRRILELNEDDLLRLTLKDHSEITGFIDSTGNNESPVTLSSTFKFDVILLHKAIENESAEELKFTRDDQLTVVYKNDVEAIEIIRADSALVNRRR